MSASRAFMTAGSRLSALLGFFAVAAVAGTLIACVLTPGIALAGTAAKKQITMFQDLPSNLEITPLDQKARIFAKSKGKWVQLASFFSQNRDVVKWDDVPATVRNAAIAGEDIRFYRHGAIDPNGIARAVVQNLKGRDIQGASTITQQYVKNVCVQQAENNQDRAKAAAGYKECTQPSLNRKIREMRLAIGVEKKYSKDQILLGYLNIAGFGGRTYGIEAAAQYYFHKKAKDLSTGEAATLLSIVNNPEAFRLDRKKNFDGAEMRRNYILAAERDQGMISQADYDKYSAEDIKTKITPPSTGCDSAGTAGFFCDYVVKTVLASKEFGKDPTERAYNLNTKGWSIYTSLNLDLQRQAQKTMGQNVPMKSSAFDVGSAAVSMQVGTGRVVTMVQNKKYDQAGTKKGEYSAVNFNVNNKMGAGAGFQPGSTFKTFTLIGWLMSGHSISQTVNANPRTIPASNFTGCDGPMGGAAWTFKNDSLSEKGNMTVRQGTAGSVNGVFASMAEEQSMCKVRDIAESLGAKNANGKELDLYPTTAIGVGSSIAPLDMATAYAAIANKGVTCKAIVIDKVTDSDGKSMPVPKAGCKRVIPENVAIAAGYTLRGVVTGGTMAGDQTPDGKFLFGKTGTTDDAKHTWAIGTTNKITTAVWVGNANGGANMRREFGGGVCRYSTQYAIKRHCIFRAIQTEMNRVYGGSSSWPTPEGQFLYGGAAIQHQDAQPVSAPKPEKKDDKSDDKRSDDQKQKPGSGKPQ